MKSIDPAAGTIIAGRYVLEGLLSQGGVGTVWRARHLTEGREVALKLLRAEFSSLSPLRRRFAREARATQRLSHTNIATVLESGTDENGTMFLVMELIDGEPVSGCMDRGLSTLNLLQLADGLLAGLAHAHARGVIHRDLKPSNILLAGTRLPEHLGQPKLVDFGIATIGLEEQDVRETQHGEVVGTPRYMSPEQAQGERNLSARTDLYNVGLILYELITGQPPFGEEKGLAVMSLHAHEPIPPIAAREGQWMPPGLERLVMRALEKRPSVRWASAAEMRTALQPFLEMARQNPEAWRTPRPVLSPARSEQSTLQEGILAHTPPTNPVIMMPRAPERQAVFTPVEDAVAAERLPAGLGTFQRLPFVGRPEEREFLMGVARRVRDESQGCVVLIEGEAGVGKTRLTVWLKEQVEESGMLQGHVGAFARGSGGGLRGLQEVLESMFRTRGLSRERVRLKVETRLSEWGQAHPEDASTITDFLRPATAVGESFGQRVEATNTGALFAAMGRVLELAAQHQPRLILLDDIQWGGRELADFLDYLAVEMRHRAVPLMVVATLRSEELVDYPALATKLGELSRYVGETVERLPLGRLRRPFGLELVRAMLPVDDALAEIVYNRSDGNPLHLVMLLRFLREEGMLRLENGLWHARDVSDVLEAVPPSLADLFTVRVRQIEERRQTHGRLVRLLHRAALIGASFHYDVLDRVMTLENDPELCQHFEADFEVALAEGFITESQNHREDWYVFSHGLVRDYFLRDRSAASVARKLHRFVALAMEEVLKGRTESDSADIASHWRKAREPQRALHWQMRAATTYERTWLLREATEAFQVCRELSEELLGVGREGARADVSGQLRQVAGHQPEVFQDYLSLLAHLGDLHEGLGEFTEAEEVFRTIVRASARLDTPLDLRTVKALGMAWLGLGHVAWQRGDLEAADWAFEHVRELVTGHDSLGDLDDAAARGLARVAWHRGEYDRATELAQVVLWAARMRGDKEAEAESLWIKGDCERMLGHGDSARSFYEPSLALYESIDNVRGIARNLLSMAQLARYQKSWPEAERLYLEALRRYERLGDRRGTGQCFNGLGDIARFEHRFVEARANYGRALEIYKGIGATYDVAVVYTNLGLTALALSDFEGAQRFISSAKDLIDGEDFPYLQAGVEYNLALVEALRGHEQESSLILEKVLDRSERIPIADLDYAQPLEQLARLKASAGRWQEAVTLWEKAGDIYRELDLVSDLERVERCIATYR